MFWILKYEFFYTNINAHHLKYEKIAIKLFIKSNNYFIFTFVAIFVLSIIGD